MFNGFNDTDFQHEDKLYLKMVIKMFKDLLLFFMLNFEIKPHPFPWKKNRISPKHICFDIGKFITCNLKKELTRSYSGIPMLNNIAEKMHMYM